jgi:hypothetical protein
MIDELPDAQAAEAEVLLVALLRGTTGAAEAIDDESAAWLDVGVHDAMAGLAAVETDVPEDVQKAWLDKLDRAATPIAWDDAKGEFVEVGA